MRNKALRSLKMVGTFTGSRASSGQLHTTTDSHSRTTTRNTAFTFTPTSAFTHHYHTGRRTTSSTAHTIARTAIPSSGRDTASALRRAQTHTSNHMNTTQSSSDGRPSNLRDAATIMSSKNEATADQRGKAAQDTSLGRKDLIRTPAFSPADIKGFPPAGIVGQASPPARGTTSNTSLHTSTMHNYHDRGALADRSAKRLSLNSLHNVQKFVHCAKVTRRLFSHNTTLSSTTTTTTTLERDTQRESLHNVQKFVHCARDFSKETLLNEVGA